MRKLVISLVMLLLASNVFILQAKPIADLTALADEMPVDTAFFAVARTDDGYIEELDALLAQASAFLPMGEVRITDALNNVFFGADFADVRPWLGDTVAVGLQLNAETIEADAPPTIIIAEITDADATRDFFTQTLLSQLDGDVAFSEIPEGYQLLASEYGGTLSFTITADHLIFSAEIIPVPLNLDQSLADSPRFGTSINALATDDYNIMVYVDFPAWINAIREQGAFEREPMMAGFVSQMGDLLGTFSMGFTILNGNTLTVDISQIVNPNALTSSGVAMPTRTLDLGFASNIPADAPLVIHSADFGASTQASLDALYNLQDSVDAQGGWGVVLDIPEFELRRIETQVGLELFDLRKLVGFGNVTFSGLTGMSLQKDVLPRLGDMAVFVRVLPSQAIPFLPILPDMGISLQTSADDATFLFDNIVTASEAYDANYPVADVDGGRTLTVTALSELANADGLLDILLGAGDDVLVMGTVDAVQDVLSGTNTLADNADFQNASAVFLPDANQVLYIATQPIVDVLGDLLETGDLEGDAFNQLRLVRGILPVVRHSTLTTAFDAETGVIQVRGTITLGER